MKLNIRAFALSAGILSGIGVFLFTWWVIAFEGATYGPTFMSYFYRGYTISPLGSFIGLIWGFAEGIIVGGVFAFLYNTLLDKSSGS